MTTAPPEQPHSNRLIDRSSWTGWAIVLFALIVAAILRFWQLGDIPAGLYRDEAINGLDALDVISGEGSDPSPFYFSANNGREPLYIYLTAISVSAFGSSAFAVRLAAAVIGTLTTLAVYGLAAAWFGQKVGWLSAWLWAITVWPIHLSRIGFRPILLPLFMSLTLWVATLAYRHHASQRWARWLWFLSGLLYGISFYTYISVRFTPIFLLAFVIYLRLTSRHKPLWPGAAWAALGTAIALIPLVSVAIQDPELVIGRMGQVSILNPAINEGAPFKAMIESVTGALGLFFVQGDSIVRHNPPGRPVFDLFMVIPFVIGLIWCVRSWRRPAAMALLMWVILLLGPTILAEDSPHFLRASGVLPAVVMVPSIGLSQLWTWTKLPSRLGLALVLLLTIGSLSLTVYDYFMDYGQDSTTGYWFESAARELAENANREEINSVMIDQRYREGWPSIPFLLDADKDFTFYRPADLKNDEIAAPAVIYAWPHELIEAVTAAIDPPAVVSGETGDLAQGDLDPEPYPLFVRFEVEPFKNYPVLANFDNGIQLRHAELQTVTDRLLRADLYWSVESEVDQPLVTFIHVVGRDGIVGQSDSVPSQGNWPSQQWRPGLIIRDTHMIELLEKFDGDYHHIQVGLNDAATRDRLKVLNTGGEAVDDIWQLMP